MWVFTRLPDKSVTMLVSGKINFSHDVNVQQLLLLLTMQVCNNTYFSYDLGVG